MNKFFVDLLASMAQNSQNLRGHTIGPGHRSVAVNRYARRTASLGSSRKETTSYLMNRKTGEVLPRTRTVTSVVWP